MHQNCLGAKTTAGESSRDRHEPLGSGRDFCYQRNFDKARKIYDEALELFTEQGNAMWMGQVEQQLAIGLLQENSETNLQDAFYYISNALYLCDTHHRALILRRLTVPDGLQLQGNVTVMHFHILRQGIEAAEAVSDQWFRIANCVQDSELAYEQWKPTILSCEDRFLSLPTRLKNAKRGLRLCVS